MPEFPLEASGTGPPRFHARPRNALWAYLPPVVVALMLVMGLGFLAYHADSSRGLLHSASARLLRHADRSAALLEAGIRLHCRPAGPVDRKTFETFLG